MNREKAETAAWAWLRNAGLYYEDPDQVLAHLFGKSGLLREARGDIQLQKDLINEWFRLRPIGIESERKQTEYQQSFATNAFHQKRWGRAVFEPDPELAVIMQRFLASLHPPDALPSGEGGQPAPETGGDSPLLPDIDSP